MAANTSYSFGDFRFEDYLRDAESSAAPKIKKVPAPQLVPERKRSKREIEREAKLSRVFAFRILTLSAVLLVFLGMLIYGRVQIMNVASEVDKLQTQYIEAQSENVRLESEVKEMYSVNNIVTYAEEELGMVKKDNYQINYFSVD